MSDTDEDVIESKWENRDLAQGRLALFIQTFITAAPPGSESSWMVLEKAWDNIAKNRHAAHRERGGPWSVTSCWTPLSFSALLLQHVNVLKVSPSIFWLWAPVYPPHTSFLPEEIHFYPCHLYFSSLILSETDLILIFTKLQHYSEHSFLLMLPMP